LLPPPQLLVVAVCHRYFRYRERLRELDVAEKAIDRSDADRLAELMSAVCHASVDQFRRPAAGRGGGAASAVSLVREPGSC